MFPHSGPSADDAKPCNVSTSLHATSESTPLIAGASTTPAQPQRAGATTVDILLNATTAVHVRKSHNADGIDAILCAVILLCAGSAGLWIIPATRQVEDIVCRQHYGVLEPNDGDTPINEDRCKENAIQSKVAMVFAIYSALQATLAAASAVPWGNFADRVGRKMVLSLAVLGIMLDQLWFLLKFMAAHLSSMIGNLSSPMIAGWMMKRTGPWPVMWLSLSGFATMGFTIRLIPETQPAAVLTNTFADELEADSPIISTIQHTSHRLQEFLSLIKLPSLVLLLVAMLTSFPIVLSTYQFMIIFSLKCYQISTSQTGYLSFFYSFSMFSSSSPSCQAFQSSLPHLGRQSPTLY
ncbi:LOW QUALITY PROTEIN: major facilitator superfamily transporter [Colletotrichum tofieldiae]|nr:LOW QUALITY PROTEIN: major facilitator superfamily transporter [Colletotrichum tofieldiae]